MNLSMKQKIYGGFGVVLVLMLIMSVVAYIMIDRVQAANNDAMENMNDIIFTVEKEVDHLAWLNDLADSFLLEEKFTGQLDHSICDFGQWYFGILESDNYTSTTARFREIFASMEEPHRQLHQTAADIVSIFENTALEPEERREVALFVYQQETQVYINEIRELMNDLAGYMMEQKDEYVAQAQAQGAIARVVLIVSFLIAFLIGVMAAIVINRGITNPVKSVVDFLRHMVVASREISSGNQDLSQRTEEQASSLEEVTSNVEEMTFSIETSAANANEADSLSKGTLESVHRGETVIRELQESMQDITQGSHEIAEIISKVNDISFQTNLLALNAAVEAARAGEQGRGFAVVAAEVRNLAGRSANSAKEIEKLIKQSIGRVEKGNMLMSDSQKVLEEIVQNTQKTADVVGEIASSLREQTTASSEIRAAIEELNEVTQQNASLVEQIASASENMSSEATELTGMIERFKLDAGGSNDTSQAGYLKNYDKEGKRIAKTHSAGEKEPGFDVSDFEQF